MVARSSGFDADKARPIEASRNGWHTSGGKATPASAATATSGISSAISSPEAASARTRRARTPTECRCRVRARSRTARRLARPLAPRSASSVPSPVRPAAAAGADPASATTCPECSGEGSRAMGAGTGVLHAHLPALWRRRPRLGAAHAPTCGGSGRSRRPSGSSVRIPRRRRQRLARPRCWQGQPGQCRRSAGRPLHPCARCGRTRCSSGAATTSTWTLPVTSAKRSSAHRSRCPTVDGPRCA